MFATPLGFRERVQRLDQDSRFKYQRGEDTIDHANSARANLANMDDHVVEGFDVTDKIRDSFAQPFSDELAWGRGLALLPISIVVEAAELAVVTPLRMGKDLVDAVYHGAVAGIDEIMG